MDATLIPAVTGMAAKGADMLRGNRHKAQHTNPDTRVDALLGVAAILPQLFNLLVPSPLTERFIPMKLSTLYRLYKARPYLEGLGAIGLAALTYRQRLRDSKGAWLSRTAAVTAGTKFLAQLISPSTAFRPQEGHLVVTAKELNRLLEPTDQVLGLYLNGEARCYPLSIMRKPHLLHDSVGGIPVVPTYCEFTNSALAFRDEWQGQRLALEVVAFPNNNIVFYEGHSDGMIQQLEAAIGAGPNEGNPLQVFPLMVTSWKHWQALHPDTTGLWFDQELKEGALKYVMEAVERLDARSEGPLYAVEGGVDTRLPAKEPVLAVRIKGRAKAYTRDYLRDHPVLHDELAGEPIVVFFDAERDVAAAYLRRTEDGELSFEEAVHGRAIAEDQTHGLLWDVAGCAQVGRQAERCLKPVPFTLDKVHWFAWAHFYPETTVAGQGQRTAPVPQG